MNWDIAIKAMVSMMPAAVLTVALLHLDTHRIVPHRFLMRVFASGGGLAVLAYGLNTWLLSRVSLDLLAYSRLLAPLVEETLKAALVLWLFRRDRIGFSIDAAIVGFTIGAGFSFVENIYYLFHASDAHYVTWMARGFGTAIMHGGCTAIFAVVTQIISDRDALGRWLGLFPGLTVAIAFHSLFNHFPVSPAVSVVATFLIITTVLFLLFERSEVGIHNFLEQDFERHRRLLRQLQGQGVSDCRTGQFLRDLERFFADPARAHMRSYIRLHTELVLSAERTLLARERGAEVLVVEETRDMILKLHELERRIGKLGMRTLAPHLQLSKHEFWLVHMFEDEMVEESAER